jgi:hypothetical protein
MILLGVLFLLPGGVMAGGTNLQKLSDGTCAHSGVNLMWQIKPSKKKFADEDAARQYIKDLDLGGHHDWRMPTEVELDQLLGLIAIQGNEDCKLPKLKKPYWLIDSHKKTIPARLELDCLCSGEFNVIERSKAYVRAVRTIK